MADSEQRANQRLSVRKKCVIEKRGIKFSCHLKDICVDGKGVSFVSQADFALHEHLILDVKDLVDSRFQGVECVVRVLHISEWHGQNVYGCEVVFSNEKFKEVVEFLNNRQVSSRLRFFRRPAER